MSKKLTAIKVEQIKPNPSKRIEVPDAGKPGLYLVIQPSGKRSWCVRYRSAGRPRKVTLEGFPTLGTARQLAQQVLDAVAQGRDPAAEKKTAKRQADTDNDSFRVIAETFLTRHARAKTRASSASATERLLRKEILPKWGDRRIQEITKRDVIELLDGIMDKGTPILANRVLAVIKKLFSWAVERDILPASPALSVKRPAIEQSRDRILSDEEIRLAWQAFNKAGYPFGDAAKLMLLTGQRRNEVCRMTWGELDLDNRIWRIPGDRAKNGRDNTVPLSDAAMEIIESLPRIKTDEGFIFTPDGLTAVSGFARRKRAIDVAMSKIAGATIEPWVLHDLRRTAASGMARLGVSMPVVEKLLNHVSGSFAGVAGVYQRFDFADEKRNALQAWENFVLSIVEGRPENVVSIAGARA